MAKDGRQVSFFLEYDTGSEQLSVLVDKLPGYRDLFRAVDRAWPVLFWLHSAARERHLRQRLSQSGATALAVTGTRDHGAAQQLSAAGPMWLPAGVVGSRMRAR